MPRPKLILAGVAGLALVVGILAAVPAGLIQARDGAQVDCQVGNPGVMGQDPVPEIFGGEEEWAYLIYPPEQCDCPQGGFRLLNVNMELAIDPPPGGVDFAAVAILREAIFDPDTDCYVPGDEIYVSPPATFFFQEPGIFLISVPTPDASCEIFDEHYFIGLRYLESFMASIITDDQPAPCTTYVDDGNGWRDFYDLRKSAGGKPIIWGDIVCCDAGIPVEDGTWSTVKGLYR